MDNTATRQDHDRVSPEGRAIGESTSRLAERGHARLLSMGLTNVNAPGLRDEMCPSCACRAGSVPNGCLQTQMDLLKSAQEGVPFLCHAPSDGRLCAGWVRVRAEIVANPLPKQISELLEDWEYSPPDAEADAGEGDGIGDANASVTQKQNGA